MGTHSASLPAVEHARMESAANITDHYARNAVMITLGSAVLFLAALAGWLWYGAHLYQNCL